MSFKADDEIIREFGSLMSGLYGDAQQVPGYVRHWVALSYSDGRMFANIKSAADDAVEALTSNFEKLTSISLSSCEQLNLAADYYEDTDAAAAARVDGTY